MQQGHRVPGAGAALVVLAGLCWGLSGGIAAVLLADGWGAFVLALYRGATPETALAPVMKQGEIV